MRIKYKDILQILPIYLAFDPVDSTLTFFGVLFTYGSVHFFNEEKTNQKNQRIPDVDLSRLQKAGCFGTLVAFS
ncbi:hypothetical protein [Aliifodinibius sp. S!AR15-10]|uniref:hypothetical protein n=1 Tax=Aliifodinibius sp. S!AR15-10 TaxID=2950437 RepID=UPI00286FD32B|nr:hypothetical protein [Aliifodinibius sp. S!AR15-10]